MKWAEPRSVDGGVSSRDVAEKKIKMWKKSRLKKQTNQKQISRRLGNARLGRLILWLLVGDINGCRSKPQASVKAFS